MGKNIWSELPPLQLPDSNAVPHTLSEWKGKVLVVNFFATWCAPCRYEVPHLIKLQEQFGKDGLQIIGIGFDEKDKVKNYVRSLEITYPVLVAEPDHNKALMEQWGNTTGAIPYLLVVDQTGVVTLSRNGGLSEREFDWFVKPLLSQ